MRPALASATAALLAGACIAPAETGPESERTSWSSGSRCGPGAAAAAERPREPWDAGGAIVVCGQRFPVDTRVVLWDEPPYYDAHHPEPRFASAGSREPRYRPGRDVSDSRLAAQVAREGWSVELLAQALDLFVLHYDACGTSQECFRVLHDVRDLSVHFLLDVDGTIYQTLDLCETAWHAGAAVNPRSIGIEMAHVGAFPPSHVRQAYRERYERDADGPRLVLGPADGVRTQGFVARPARPGLVAGSIHGQDLRQYDFTPEQYEALEALTATLVGVLPRIALELPRDDAGLVRHDALGASELERFRGILGHWHVGAHKVDPGPAFDWERFLAGVRARSEP